MQIPHYLPEVEHAVNTVLTELHAEHEQLAILQVELAALTAATEDGYRQAEFLRMNPDLDDDGLGTAIQWDTYFGVDKDRFHKAKDVGAAEGRISARAFSVAALSGSLLQYAKQGISLQYGKGRDGCPVGREIAGLPLHEVIWQGRNQALHWEDGAFHARTTALFEHLATTVDPLFAEYKTRSVAYDLIKLLGWRTTEDFMRDMRLLE